MTDPIPANILDARDRCPDCGRPVDEPDPPSPGQFLAAWLAGRQATIAKVLAKLPAGMAPETQAANVHAALLAEAGQPGTPVRIQWAVQLPGNPFGLRIAGGETEAREALADQRAEHRPSDGPAPELVRRLVGDWQPVAVEG